MNARATYRRFVITFAVIAIGIGIAMLVQAARYGGLPRYVIGALFIALGSARLWMLRKT
jgi:hypothetical protein